jgi:hypothetical protein
MKREINEFRLYIVCLFIALKVIKSRLEKAGYNEMILSKSNFKDLTQHNDSNFSQATQDHYDIADDCKDL